MEWFTVIAEFCVMVVKFFISLILLLCLFDFLIETPKQLKRIANALEWRENR